MDKNKQIVFDDKGVILSNGVMCEWDNVEYIEFRGSWPSLKLIIQTVSECHIEYTALYVFNFEKLKQYISENHPNVPCDNYVIELPGGFGWRTKYKREFKSFKKNQID